MDRITVDVNQVLLWESNPRVDAAQGQLDELKKIYDSGSGELNPEKSRRQLMKLLDSIATKGYQNKVDPILAVEVPETGHPSKYIVRDGNRRVSAIKLLSDLETYKGILDKKDYQSVKKRIQNYAYNIPSKLEIVTFRESEEEEELKNIIERKHNGALDGQGTVKWTPQAKTRFLGRGELVDAIDERFEKETGQTLAEYIGEKNNITSTRRVFGFKVVKEYIAAEDPEALTDEELKRVREVADQLRELVSDTGKPLSRLLAGEVEQKIIRPLKAAKGDPAGKPAGDPAGKPAGDPAGKPAGDPDSNKKPSAADDYLRNLDHKPGYRYLSHSEWFDYENENFNAVNALLEGLNKYGSLPRGTMGRRKKAFLLIPAARVIYELTLEAGVESKLPFKLKDGGVSANHKTNVSRLHELLKDNHFITYLSRKGIISDSFKEIRSLIETAKFADSVDATQLTSHKGLKHANIDRMMTLFDEAVLFAMLTEQLALYSSTSNSADNSDVIQPSK